MKDNWCSAFSRRVSYGGEGGVMKTRQHPQPQTQAKTLSVGQENHRMFGPVLVAMAVLLISVLMIFSVLPAMAQAAGYSAEEVQFLELINDYRQQNGLNALLLSDTVEDAARKHNLDMGHYGFFDHSSLQADYSPEGSAPWDRMEAVGYNYNTYTGENIAAGYETASQVFQGWKNSPGHNANMLKPEYKVIGISREYVSGSPYGYYWNTDFGGYVDPSAHTAGTAGGGVHVPAEIRVPVVSVGRTGDVFSGDPYHLVLRLQHVRIVPGGVLPALEHIRSRLIARRYILARPGIIRVANGFHPVPGRGPFREVV